ncbi:DNA-binding transcriptional regulator YbjK [Arthrobacter sp. GAS37]|uniref:TetR/AcrR family transcriptional regulator n=1 Tax=Arthrobacter sp. GAS37 TaxID=3156261 RepID=UPI003835D8A2
MKFGWSLPIDGFLQIRTLLKWPCSHSVPLVYDRTHKKSSARSYASEAMYVRTRAEGGELMDAQDPPDRFPPDVEWSARSDVPRHQDSGRKELLSPSPAPDVASSFRIRRFDPDRRNRIIDAVLAVIAENGVAGTSFRRIATQADVPLGSMTYHFSGMQELLETGFERFVSQSLARLEDRLEPARDHRDAGKIILAIIHEDATADPPRHLALSRELQALVIRDPALRNIANEWVEGSARILKRYFDPITAVILEILMDGLTLRRGVAPTKGEPLAADPVASVIDGSWRPSHEVRRKR